MISWFLKKMLGQETSSPYSGCLSNVEIDEKLSEQDQIIEME